MRQQDQASRIIGEDTSANAAELESVIDGITESADDTLAANAAELAAITGEMVGQVHLKMDESDAAMYKPIRKIMEVVDNAQGTNDWELSQVGYKPKFYYSDVRAALENPDQLEVLVNSLAAESDNGNVTVDGNTIADINTITGVVPFVPRLPSPPYVPPPVPIQPPAANCVVAGPLDPINPARLICAKGGEGEGETTYPPVPAPAPECPPVDGCCAPPVINVMPAPVRVVFRPPENPADLQPGECSPGDPDCQPEPECPEVPDVIVNNNIVSPGIKFPEPKEQPLFKFSILDPAPPGAGIINWDSEDGCDKALEICDRWNGIVDGVGGQIQDVADFAAGRFGKWVSNALGIANVNGTAVMSAAFSIFSGTNSDSQDSFTVRMTAAAFSQVRLIKPVIENNFGPDAACAMAPITMKMYLTQGLRDFGFDADYLTTPLQYEYQYIYPVYIPSQVGVDALWLGDRISDEQHECLTRSNGNLPHLHRMLAEEQRERLRIDEWIDLYLRGKIDFDKVKRESRKLGWLDQDQIAYKTSLQEQIPPFSDVIRMMVRDVENKDAIIAGQLDNGFTDNFQGILRQYANAQGITEEVALRYWRAHWQWPSNTQLFNMLHRLRPGVVDESVVTTVETVRKAIEINDVAPAFIDRMIATSYNPLTRVDVRRAYEIGVLTYDDVMSAYLDLGYDKKNAKTLADFIDRDIKRKVQRKSNVWSLSAVSTAYQNGSIDRSFAFSKARKLLDSDDVAEEFITDVEAKRGAVTRAACIKSLKKRFMMGELDYSQSIDGIFGYTQDRTMARTIVEGWECERNSRRKEIAAGTLCKWLYQGIVTQAQYFTRLLNLGYTQDDAERMLQSCGQDVIDKMKAKAIKEAKDALQRLKDLQKAQEKRLKETQAAYKKFCEKAKETNPDFVCAAV